MSEEVREYITPEIEKRQHRRANLVAQVQCETLGRDEFLVTRDISVGGLFISSKNPFPKDSEISLSLRLTSGDQLLFLRGKVVYAMKNLGMGIQFTEISEDARQAVQKFIDETA